MSVIDGISTIALNSFSNSCRVMFSHCKYFSASVPFWIRRCVRFFRWRCLSLSPKTALLTDKEGAGRSPISPCEKTLTHFPARLISERGFPREFCGGIAIAQPAAKRRPFSGKPSKLRLRQKSERRIYTPPLAVCAPCGAVGRCPLASLRSALTANYAAHVFNARAYICSKQFRARRSRLGRRFRYGNFLFGRWHFEPRRRAFVAGCGGVSQGHKTA